MNALCIMAFYNACLYDTNVYTDKYAKGLLWRLEKWGKDKFWYKPIGGCLPCMASIHSILPYWLFMYFNNCIDWPTLVFYPFYILSLSGLMVFVDAIWNKLEE